MPLTLYHFRGCPYCEIVLNYMAQNQISISLKDIQEDPTHREELKRIGGETQVPCLVIDGKALYESVDIIKWLRKNWSRVSKPD